MTMCDLWRMNGDRLTEKDARAESAPSIEPFIVAAGCLLKKAFNGQ